MVIFAVETKRVSAAELGLNIQTAAVEFYRPCIFDEKIGSAGRVEGDNALLVILIRPVEQFRIDLQSIIQKPVAGTQFIGF